MVKVLRNEEKNGIELYFESKPGASVIAELKENHFRWHSMKKCWYVKVNDNILKFVEKIANGEEISTAKINPVEKVNKYGVKVGDIFEYSWGYEQTNVEFFRVKELRGETQVVIQEVRLKLLEETGISGMSADRKYDINNWTIADRSVHIKDNEKGMIKKVTSFNKDNTPMIDMDFGIMTPYKGQAVYESWYY